MKYHFLPLSKDVTMKIDDMGIELTFYRLAIRKVELRPDEVLALFEFYESNKNEIKQAFNNKSNDKN